MLACLYLQLWQGKQRLYASGEESSNQAGVDDVEINSNTDQATDNDTESTTSTDATSVATGT